LGWWNSQYDGKNKNHVPNHQPEECLAMIQFVKLIRNHKMQQTVMQFGSSCPPVGHWWNKLQPCFPHMSTFNMGLPAMDIFPPSLH
jgi:hypothetical protein